MSEPTQKYSIMMLRNRAEAARARQIERDNLNELVRVAEAQHGPITEDEVRALRDQLGQARVQQTGDEASAVS
ncbi:CopG family transcriptional regulator [Streptomyces sp. enrichment culture]|uniref:CopG family transcriptional regulator n=1 Tax=Streptomyces sp. enrichment culture TaxID=1795815 RepID=UPI003F579F0D